MNSSMISIACHFIDGTVCRHFRAGYGRRPDDCWRRCGLNNVSWQAAMIAATPPGMIGTASAALAGGTEGSYPAEPSFFYPSIVKKYSKIFNISLVFMPRIRHVCSSRKHNP
ncbi:hypothetical protein WJ0W_001350 [Paenibacillus melissococcoides]|uniref:Uncharacterized protein n=1 Tax=Paenibacillus melissococcoides TaxID=2912268 RepID=A0ABN8U339_9BACL|nr:hypothetical protein WJ0W_001350 [Paenibacillus melissococcoides]